MDKLWSMRVATYSVLVTNTKYIQLFYPFRIKFVKIAAHAHMNDLSITNLALS